MELGSGDPGGIQNLNQYINTGYYPVHTPSIYYICYKGKINTKFYGKIVADSKRRSLREIAKQYRVSYETVRRTLTAAQKEQR